MKRVAVTALLVLFTIGFGKAQAAMYKWVDEEGVVHYTQSPPTDRQAEKIKASKSSPQDSSGRPGEDPLQESRDSLTPVPPPSADLEKEKRQREIAARNCEAARKNLDIYQRYRRISENQKSVVLTDEERQRRITEARQMIDKFCQ